MKYQRNIDDLVQSIGKIIEAHKDLTGQVVRQYSANVADILHTQNRDPRRIEHLLDGMLDFCFDPAMLALYKKLCRYYWDIDPEATSALRV